ncbi:tRNA pseudouridine synthase B [Coriobacterium glomerans PW2]|uniref:tRNA pseudouridine synthase B n=1 Tax=Coriobacterium glomerans (strain ATCC 49209 / DSM 20642 / JCM 10262 / PW2) TaxID=700015 RepID=F2N9P5_CORGP|nr:tRNA pseudouridine(55) synthase TruB [Coriobacterium glomerans]AEB07148.1 tRNA pseudouridine synthase B [Coriobacterium glomerans PW2]
MSDCTAGACNLLLAIDKPSGCTSHDVVLRCRRALGQRRVGHAGTLDPLASGVMIIGAGQATRLLGMLTLDVKCYVAEISFGCETNTDDIEGEVTRAAAVPRDLVDLSGAQRVLDGFLGSGEQIPPAFSAISVNGVRSYRVARSGGEIDLPPRPVTIYRADALAAFERAGSLMWTVVFEVSKGTYIRALARDIGRAAGSAAHVSALRRTASGSIRLDSCVEMDGLDRSIARESCLDPIRALGIAAVDIPARYREDILCGRRVPISAAGDLSRLPRSGDRVACVRRGELLALARRRGDDLVMDTVFPEVIEGVRI